MTAAWLIQGDARRIPLKDKSVQMVCTSPPYFGLRSYGGQLSVWDGDPDCTHIWSIESRVLQKGTVSEKQGTHKGNDESGFIAVSATCTLCGAWRGELGSEPIPAAFVAHLVEVFAEVWRVLRPDGVAFLNMGSSMAGSGKGPTGHNGLGDQAQRQGFTGNGGMHRKKLEAGAIGNAWTPAPKGYRQKSDMLIPFRLAIALDEAGWIVRQVIIWAKPNPMPESVRDRWTNSHEYILMLVKQGKYFFDQAAIREPAEFGRREGTNWKRSREADPRDGRLEKASTVHGSSPDSGRNGRSVWAIPTDAYKGAHYAVYPRELVRRCILAGTSEYGACAACGAPWRRVVEWENATRQAVGGKLVALLQSGQRNDGNARMGDPTTTTTGWVPTCKCGPDAGVRPCVVLDPFGGSQTTAYVAASMGRRGVGVELSAEYITQARYGRLAQEFLPLGAAHMTSPDRCRRVREALGLEVGA